MPTDHFVSGQSSNTGLGLDIRRSILLFFDMKSNMTVARCDDSKVLQPKSSYVSPNTRKLAALKKSVAHAACSSKKPVMQTTSTNKQSPKASTDHVVLYDIILKMLVGRVMASDEELAFDESRPFSPRSR